MCLHLLCCGATSWFIKNISGKVYRDWECWVMFLCGAGTRTTAATRRRCFPLEADLSPCVRRHRATSTSPTCSSTTAGSTSASRTTSTPFPPLEPPRAPRWWWKVSITCRTNRKQGFQFRRFRSCHLATSVLSKLDVWRFKAIGSAKSRSPWRTIE